MISRFRVLSSMTVLDRSGLLERPESVARTAAAALALYGTPAMVAGPKTLLLVGGEVEHPSVCPLITPRVL
jgi:hypothetical protein